MPTIAVKRDLLFEALGQTYSDDEFQNLCFAFGLELDEVTTEKQMIAKEQGKEQSTGASEEVIYKIDVPANRYDLLCLEGLVTGLLIFLEKIERPYYRLIYPTKYPDILEKITISNTCKFIRPHVVGAILRGVTLTQNSYNSFIDLQDKLHQNIGRKRSLVSIGTHDYGTISGPLTYTAKQPQDICFVPLNQTEYYNGHELMELYAHHAQLKQYLLILKDSSLFPVIYDSRGVVSLPPIINSDRTKITLETKDIFIECTATDLTKAKIVLDTIVCAFSQYCNDKFTVEPINIIYSKTKKVIRTPELIYRMNEINGDDAAKYIGIDQSPQEIAKLLSKMCLKTEVKSGNTLVVTIPPTRHDVIHACDIYEDIAIAWGYNNIKKTVPDTPTIGREFPLNKLTDHLRLELAESGFTEALTFALCSREDVADKLNWNFDSIPAVTISNPKALEFQVARTTLLPGLLKTLVANKKMPLPLKIFEVSDVVLRDAKAECGARNERRLCAVYCNKSAGFEIIHGLLDRVMLLLEIPWSTEKSSCGYYLDAVEDPTYFPQRCANIFAQGKLIGKMGVLHPQVLQKFDLHLPCSALEINIEPFL